MYAPETGEKSGRKKERKAAGGRPEQERDETYAVDEEGYHIRIPTSQVKRSSRIGIIISGFLLAGMVLFILTGYEKITRAYADINTLSNEIEQTNLRIVALNVEIECAVTIQQAQEAASRFGMVFPDTSDSVHYQVISDNVKFPDEVLYPALADTASADTAGAAPAAGDTAAAPDGSTGNTAPDGGTAAAPGGDTAQGTGASLAAEPGTVTGGNDTQGNADNPAAG